MENKLQNKDLMHRVLETMKIYKKNLRDRNVEYRARMQQYGMEDSNNSYNLSKKVLNSFHNVIKVL